MMAQPNQSEPQLKKAQVNQGSRGMVIAAAAVGSFVLSRVAEFAGLFVQVGDERPQSGRAFIKGSTVSMVLNGVSGLLGFVALSKGMESSVLTGFGRKSMELMDAAGMNTSKLKSTALIQTIKRNEAAIIQVEQEEHFGVAKEKLDTSHLRQEVQDKQSELSALMGEQSNNVNLLRYIHDAVKDSATELERTTRNIAKKAEKAASKQDNNLKSKASSESLTIEYHGAFTELHTEVDGRIKAAMSQELDAPKPESLTKL